MQQEMLKWSLRVEMKESWKMDKELSICMENTHGQTQNPVLLTFWFVTPSLLSTEFKRQTIKSNYMLLGHKIYKNKMCNTNYIQGEMGLYKTTIFSAWLMLSSLNSNYNIMTLGVYI